MPEWQRRTIGILDVGGAGVGIAVSAAQLFSAPLTGVSFLYLPFIAIYAWGGWIGVRLLERNVAALAPNVLFWAIQVISVHVGKVMYSFACGAYAILGLEFVPDDMRLNFNAFLGSTFRIWWSSDDADRSSLGANLLAIAVVVLLLRAMRRARA